MASVVVKAGEALGGIITEMDAPHDNPYCWPYRSGDDLLPRPIQPFAAIPAGRALRLGVIVGVLLVLPWCIPGLFIVRSWSGLLEWCGHFAYGVAIGAVLGLIAAVVLIFGNWRAARQAEWHT